MNEGRLAGLAMLATAFVIAAWIVFGVIAPSVQTTAEQLSAGLLR